MSKHDINSQSKLDIICQDIYEELQDEATGLINVDKFITILHENGILLSDPRIARTLSSLRTYSSESTMGKNFVTLPEFRDSISQNLYFVEKVFSKDFHLSNFADFRKDVEALFESCREERSGNNATYIPILNLVNPDLWAVSICTADGQRCSFGDADTYFSLQSVSKVFTYCMVVEEVGTEEVHRHVGREPSGEEFNALKLNRNGLPHNPYINAGAIMICSLVGRGLDEEAVRFAYVMDFFWRLCGHVAQMQFDNLIYLSERKWASRNYALAYFMEENQAFPQDTNLKEVLELYFQMCSLSTTSAILSIAAGTLANAGVCPITQERILSNQTVRDCLSLMMTSGMYDYSGEFAFSVGLPAKSGVGGAIISIVPGVMGIVTFSPPLDKFGNSVRGVKFLKDLANKFALHHFDTRRNEKLFAPSLLPAVSIISLAASGDLLALRRMKKFKVLRDVMDYDKRTPLHLASSNGHIHIVQYLLSFGGLQREHVEAKDRWGQTPRDCAENEGHLGIVDLLDSFVSFSADNSNSADVSHDISVEGFDKETVKIPVEPLPIIGQLLKHRGEINHEENGESGEELSFDWKPACGTFCKKNPERRQLREVRKLSSTHSSDGSE